MSTMSRLPGPVADLWEWQFDGSCRRENPDVFFHPDRERGSLRRSRDSTAKACAAGARSCRPVAGTRSRCVSRTACGVA